MAAEKPKVRLHIEFGADQALAIFAAGFGNFADAVEHQHRRQRQLGVARAKQLATAAGQQILIFITAAPIQHGASLSQNPDEAFCEWTRFAWEARQLSSDWREYRRSG